VWAPSQIAARRAEKRKPNFYAEINLWGFVSIMLALLFLLIGDRRPHQQIWVSVDLPAAQNATSEPSALREDAIRVSVTRDGSLYFRRDRTTIENLPYLIQTALRAGAEKKVYLAADRRARYVDVEVTVGTIQASGITDVVILAYKSGL
jgi:biopolymer transport protein ExbD